MGVLRGSLSFAAQAQIYTDKSPLTPIYAALQNAAPAPAMRPIPAALTNACSPKAEEIKNQLAFETGTVHYMLDRLYVWHTYKQLDGSLCAWLDAPSGQLLTRNDVQALETVSWLKTPQKPSASIIGDNIPPPGPVARAISPDFVRTFTSQPCEADTPPSGNVMMITPFIGVTTAALANASAASQGCIYSPIRDPINPSQTVRRIDVVNKGIGASATGLSNVAFVELQEAALVQPPPYRFSGVSNSNPFNIVPLAGDFGYSVIQTGINALAFPGNFEYLSGKLNLRQIVQDPAPSGCPGLTAPPAIFGGALVIQVPALGLEGVVGVVSGASAACLGGSQGGIFAVNRYAGERLTSTEFAKFLAFEAAAQPALAIRLFQPKESTTIDVALASTQLGCDGPSVTSEIAWRSSLISPVTGTNEVGTGCYIPANKLARGTQMLTVYRTTDPRRKSSVKINAIKSEATLSLSRTGEYILPAGSFSLKLNISWSSQDVGSHVLLTEQIDAGPETLISDALYGTTTTQIGVNHLATYRLRRATPNFALTGGVLDENAVTVLAAPVVPLQTPTMVTYPFEAFRLRTSVPSFPTDDCPTGVCTFVLQWLSDGSFGVVHEIKQRRLDHCNSFAPYECIFEPWIDLPNTSGLSRVITFNARFSQTDQFEFMIRACAPFRGCSDWSAPTTKLNQTLYRGSMSVSPATATWTNPSASGGECREIPPASRPTLTLNHNYPFRLTLWNFNFRASTEDQSSSYVLAGTSTARITSFGFIPGERGFFALGGSDTPVLATLNLNVESTLSADGQTWTCRYTQQ